MSIEEHIYRRVPRWLHLAAFKSMIWLLEQRGGRRAEFWFLELTPMPCGFPYPSQYLEGLWLAFWRGEECHCPVGLGQCGGCAAVASIDADEPEPPENYCRHCGKNIYDFSDLGCGHCDRRSPEWGIEE